MNLTLETLGKEPKRLVNLPPSLSLPLFSNPTVYLLDTLIIKSIITVLQITLPDHRSKVLSKTTVSSLSYYRPLEHHSSRLTLPAQLRLSPSPIVQFPDL